MPLARGAVYSAPLLLLGRDDNVSEDENKFLVVLQNAAAMDRNASQFAFVVASSDRTQGRGPRSFEVRLDRSDGFHHGTVVDGRWVYTTWREELDRTGTYMFSLNEQCMEEISVAIFIGLQLDP